MTYSVTFSVTHSGRLSMGDGSIWQAGHTHTAMKREITDAKGKHHLLLCNPVGYPEENPYVEYGLKREDFVVEVG